MAEQFENNYSTQLNGGINAGDTTITVDAAPLTLTGDFRIIIDDELIIVGAVSGLTFTGCTRGAEGTVAATHADNSIVTHVLTAGSLAEVTTDLVTAHTGDDTNAHAASAIAFVPGSGIAATNVQAAIEEVVADVTGSTNTVGIEAFIDGGGVVLTAGVKGYIEVPFACTLTAVRMFADVSGSVVVDIWKDTYANFPPVDADSITSSTPPTISSATKSQDTTLTGWTKTFAAGDVLAFNVDSATTITRVTVALRLTRT